MKIKPTLTRISLLLVALAALSIGALAQTTGAETDQAAALLIERPNAQPTVMVEHFSFFGATRGQTVRVNAYLLVGPEYRSLAVPLPVEFIIHDLQGNVVARMPKTLQPNQGAYFDLNLDQLDVPFSRLELAPCIRTAITPDIRVPMQLLGSTELIDNATGRTQVAMMPNTEGKIYPPGPTIVTRLYPPGPTVVPQQ